MSVLESVSGAQGRPGWPSSGSRPCSTCSPPTRAATSTAPARPTSRTCVVGDEAAVLATGAVGAARGGPGPGRAVVDVVVRDDTGPPRRSSSSTSPGGPSSSRPGTEAIFFGKVDEYRGSRQMANPVVDVVAGVTPGRRTLRILPVYPASAKAGLTSLGDRRLRRGGARAGRRVRRPAARRSGATRSTCGTAPRPSGPSTRPSRSSVVEPARRRLVFDELFRLQLALVLRRRAFEVNARALHHDVSPREVTGGGRATRWWRGSWPACPTSSPRPSAGPWP